MSTYDELRVEKERAEEAHNQAWEALVRANAEFYEALVERNNQLPDGFYVEEGEVLEAEYPIYLKRCGNWYEYSGSRFDEPPWFEVGTEPNAFDIEVINVNDVKF